MTRSMLLACALAVVPFASFPSSARANGWQGLTNPPPFYADTMFLLMDGRVLVNDVLTVHWWILTPDANGSYLNGTWSPAADSHDDRLYYASGVLADGRVIVAGGEYSNSGGSWSPRCEIYDPAQDTWTTIPPPTGWNNVGDAPSTVLNDGRFFMGSDFDRRTAIFDPVTNTWSPAADCNDPTSSDEQTWTLLADGTVLTEECFGAPASDLYDPVHDVWIALGNTPINLVNGGAEIGPGLLLYTGDVFQLGATPHSLRYTPSPNYAGVGTWVDGGDPPVINGVQVDADDAPACILPSGNVLCALGHDFDAPAYFCEYDGTQFIRVADPGNNQDPAFAMRLLPLPTGEVLCGDGSIWLYTPDGAPNAAWKPTITSMATDLCAGQSYLLSGTQLNGLTTGNSYGDECGVETNYPIVRLTYTATNHVVYCRAHDRTTCAIATGATPITTHVDVPAGAELGAANLEVIANGIASDPLPVQIRAPTVIDFDALAAGVVVDAQYSQATFSAPAGFANWTVALNGGSSQPNVLMTGPDSGGSDGLEETDIDFENPVASLSFSAVGVDATGPVASVNVFQGGVLTTSVEIDGAGDPATPVRVDLTAFTDVTRIELVAINDAGGIAWDDFQFCLASTASYHNYGSGFPGTLGIPSLTASAPPVLGSTFDVDVGNSLGAATSAILVFGLNPASLTTSAGGTLLVDPLLLVPIGLDAAGATLAATLLPDPALCGTQVYLQLLELDPGAAHRISFTAGLDLVLGN